MSLLLELRLPLLKGGLHLRSGLRPGLPLLRLLLGSLLLSRQCHLDLCRVGWWMLHGDHASGLRARHWQRWRSLEAHAHPPQQSALDILRRDLVAQHRAAVAHFLDLVWPLQCDFQRRPLPLHVYDDRAWLRHRKPE